MMLRPLLLASLLLAATVLGRAAQKPAAPLAGPDLVFAESDGLVAFEAEHFVAQEEAEVRAFHLFTPTQRPRITPDTDDTHLRDASGGAYLEILPDTRWTHDEPLIAGENFSNVPGKLAILSYKVHFTNPGRYRVWARTYSTGSEDNGVHFGLDDTWPESGQRWQTVKKFGWHWDSRQRTREVHVGVPGLLYLDIPSAGEHTIRISMREDGFEIDKILLAKDFDYEPTGHGPVPRAHRGRIPAAFTLPEGYLEAIAPTLPAGRKEFTGIALDSQDFPVEGTGFYRDRGRWLAIDPNQHQAASTRIRFGHTPGRYDVTLHVVGEFDGRSEYDVIVDEKFVGTFVAPLGTENFHEGPRWTQTWRNVDVEKNNWVEVRARIASADGREYSRARWIGLTFAPSAPVAAGNAPAATAPLVLPRKPDGDGAVRIEGESKQWHPVTLSAEGPYAHERDTRPNAFTDYRLTVTFAHESGTPSYEVPGYFAADGNAGQTSAEAGSVWRAHLSPDKPGRWTYRLSFVRGEGVATGDAAGTPVALLDGKTGSFAVGATDKKGRDFRAHGRLHYVGGHYLRFAGSGDYFLKAGPDAPETLLGYQDFDGTVGVKPSVPLKTWAPHLGDWRAGDPEWKDGQGRGLIGALNYLAAKGLNSFSFLTYNAAGDGDNVWPFVERNTKSHYDCSKLDQWNVVFTHAQRLGLHLHFKLQETENDDQRRGGARTEASIPEALDLGATGRERKLYLREIVARFGHHLALDWNLGEENTQTPEEQLAMGGYLDSIDPYRHPIVIHTYPGDQERVYRPLLGPTSPLTGASLQNLWSLTHRRTLQWRRESAAAGKPWVCANDEQGPASIGVPPDAGYRGFDGVAIDGDHRYTAHDVRKATLWGNLMAGGAGVEYYFGYKMLENDLVCEDFRARDQSWDFCRIALTFFREQKIPFWDMANANALVGNSDEGNSRYCFAKAGELYLVYLPEGGEASLDLSGARGTFAVSWFNPRTGGPLTSPAKVEGGGTARLTAPDSEDWLAVVRTLP
jgi:hypothetical protein